MKILNLTQHPATPEQIEAGVVDLPDEKLAELLINLTGLCDTQLKKLLTFHELPSQEDVNIAAWDIARMAFNADVDAAMIGGAPFLMGPLESALKNFGIKPLYAFSKRESVEQTQDDGSVRKVNVFKHLGFVGLD